MHIAIDDHILSPVQRNGLTQHTYTSDGGWTVSDAIAGPRQVKTARALDDWALDVKAFRGNGQREADALRAMQKGQRVVMVTDGSGKSWGRWTIVSIRTSYIKLIDNGVAQVLKISLTLREYRQDENTSLI